MDPDRWAAITGVFALEREQIEQKDSVCDAGSARRRIFHSRLPRDVHDVGKNKISVSHQRGESEKMLPQATCMEMNFNLIPNKAELADHQREENPTVVNVLKNIIRERDHQISVQGDMILTLLEDIELLKVGKDVKESCSTQTGGRSQCDDFYIDSNKSNSAEEPKLLSQHILQKMDNMEKRMDSLVELLETRFRKHCVSQTYPEKLGKEKEASSSATVSVWHKPPSFQPRATNCSVLRETRSRISSNNSTSVGARASCSWSGRANKSYYYYPRHYQSRNEDDDTNLNPIMEQRLEYLDSLVSQLKTKFVKVLLIHKKA